MNISTLEKEFRSNAVLYASELNAIVTKLNEVISALASVEPNSGKKGGVTDEEMQAAIKKEIKAESDKLKDLIAKLQGSVTLLLERTKDLPDGEHEYKSETEYLEYLKQTVDGLATTLLIDLNLLDDDGNPTFNVGMIKDLQDQIGNINKSVALLTGGYEDHETFVGLIANHFDSKGNPIYNGAQIMASINDSGESSVGINADKIRISGDTWLNGVLSAMEVKIANSLTASDLAAINATISGKADIAALEALTGTISSLQADVANIGKLTVTEQTVNRLIVDKLNAADLNLTGTFSTGTTGHVAKLYTGNNAGVLRMYDTSTPLTSSVLITDTQDGGLIVLSSPNFSVANQTGWQLTIGYNGISMQSYVRGKLSQFAITPDLVPGQNTAVINGITFEVRNSDNTLQDRRVLRVDE